MDSEQIIRLSEQYYDYASTLRNYFHENPELSFSEQQTSMRVVEELEAMGIPCQRGCGLENNVVATIRGTRKGQGKTILLRADMDALPICEGEDHPICSRHPGVMHACAHDGHTAGLLGVARILNDLRDEFSGVIKLAFESGEENGGGAKAMIDAGILRNPPVDAAFGCHLFGTVKEGRAATRAGNFMASCDTVAITIKGLGGHASTPELSIDPVMIAAQVITNAQAIVARTISPLDIGVLTFSTIHGGEFYNIIPSSLTITGSIRSFKASVREKIHQGLEGVLKGVTAAYGATYELAYSNSLPAVINDPALVKLMTQSLGTVLGKENVDLLEAPQMGGETFSYFCKEVPSCFYFLGIDADDRLPPGSNLHHNAAFRWKDENLKLYMRGLSQIALDYLNQEIK